MRRTAPAGPLTPKLFKHFAVTTVVLTGLLALFSSGEDWGARSQIGAVEANNRVLKSEAEQVGPRRLAARIAVRPGPVHVGFNEDPGLDFGERGSNNEPQDGPDQPVRPRGNPGAPPLGLADAPGTTQVVIGGTSPVDGPLLKTAKTSIKAAPTAQDLAEMTANSARRSGQSGEPD